VTNDYVLLVPMSDMLSRDIPTASDAKESSSTLVGYDVIAFTIGSRELSMSKKQKAIITRELAEDGVAVDFDNQNVGFVLIILSFFIQIFRVCR